MQGLLTVASNEIRDLVNHTRQWPAQLAGDPHLSLSQTQQHPIPHSPMQKPRQTFSNLLPVP